jgi:hypothetical protein
VSDLPPPRSPYRSAVLVHAGLAALIVLVAAVSDGDLRKAVAVAAVYFVVATAWTWFRFRQREARSSASGRDAGDGNGG